MAIRIRLTIEVVMILIGLIVELKDNGNSTSDSGSIDVNKKKQ